MEQAGSHEQKDVAERRRRQELRFFATSMINASSAIVTVWCFHFLTKYLTTKWGFFFGTGIMWQMTHSMNGYVQSSRPSVCLSIN